MRIGVLVGSSAVVLVGSVLALGLGSAHGSDRPSELRRVLDRLELPKPRVAEPVEPPADPRVLSGVPDLMQTDPELGAPGGGDSYCGPVAASNGLMWLAANGFPALAPEAEGDKQRQIRLVRRLASRSYMGTSTWSGTGASGVLKGLDLYLRAHGYRHERLEYQGWRAHQLRYSTGVRTPEPGFLADGLAAGGIALVNVGWYKPGKTPGVYRRKGGHWLTVVSAGIAADGKPDAEAIVLHDPAPWSGEQIYAHRVRAEALGEGWLIGEEGPFPSAGFRVLRGDLPVKREGEVAIVDGAVVLVPRRVDAVASAP